VYRLRATLGEDCIEAGRDTLRLNPAVVRADVTDFEALLDQGEMEKALELYRGPFLDGFHLKGSSEFEDWRSALALRLGQRFEEALEKLAVRAGGQRDWKRAIGLWERLSAHDPLNTRLALGRMRSMALSGDLGNAIQAGEEHTRLLRDELSAEAPPELTALLERLRSGEWKAGEQNIEGWKAGEGEPLETPAGRILPPSALSYPPGLPGSGRGLAHPTTGARPGLHRIPWQRIGLAGVGVLVAAAGALALGRWTAPGPGGGSVSAAYERTAIAVLPFQNLSPEGPHAYFAAALQDELLSQLARVPGISLRGRASVMGYAGTTKTIREIAEELAVGSIVEATVQILDERLRVNVHLMDAGTEEHLWAERYDRDLDDAFGVQSEIAQRIVAAVGTTLTGREARAMAAAPTDNPEAYLLYLQGLEYYRRPGYLRRNWEIAEDLFHRAVALDSTFALAFAALSEVHGWMSWFRYDFSPERLARQREAAETALRLQPDLPQAHFAVGSVHYHGSMDWRSALQEYRVALEGLPNDAELWAQIGYVHRRMGHWEEALDALERALVLDPRNVDVLGNLAGGTFLSLRRYEEAIQWLDRARRLAPDAPVYDLLCGYTWVVWGGRLDSLIAVLDRHPAEADLGFLGGVPIFRATALYWERDADGLLSFLQRTPQAVFDSRFFYLPRELWTGWAHQLRGDSAAAHEAFGSALALLDSIMVVIPEDVRVHTARGLALAGLGRREEAEEEARCLQQSRAYSMDAQDGTTPAEDRARILAGIGETDAALAEIERLLAGPSRLSVHILRLDPRFDPIRHDPRFDALLVKYAHPGPAG
jgi:serine/threonine-protein kinase